MVSSDFLGGMMIYTSTDIIVSGLVIVGITVFEYCFIRKFKRQGMSINRQIWSIYVLVAVVVAILKLVIELKFVCSKATWNLYATCVIQGADCGIYISMVRLLYCYSELKKKKQSENAEPK